MQSGFIALHTFSHSYVVVWAAVQLLPASCVTWIAERLARVSRLINLGCERIPSNERASMSPTVVSWLSRFKYPAMGNNQLRLVSRGFAGAAAFSEGTLPLSKSDFCSFLMAIWSAAAIFTKSRQATWGGSSLWGSSSRRVAEKSSVQRGAQATEDCSHRHPAWSLYQDRELSSLYCC